MATRNCCPTTSESRVYFDVTKSSRQSHHSGLNRVSRRLQEALAGEGALVVAVRWSMTRQCFVRADTGGSIKRERTEDVFFTPEVFSLSERPFMRRWIHRFRGTTGYIFYDAIPFFHPESTWPKSVRRFPRLLKDLNAFDEVFYISEKSASDARMAADELGMVVPRGNLLTLGSDFCPEACPPEKTSGVTFLQVGIIEPRKRQTLLLDTCARLWAEGFVFKVVLVGRVNPHFGKPIINHVKALQALGRDLLHFPGADDEALGKWHAGASLLISPSMSEGFGLPVLEALWSGCPVVASRQPACECVSPGSGCLVLDPMNEQTLYQTLLKLLRQPEAIETMRASVDRLKLPVWRQTARQLLDAFSRATSSSKPDSASAV